MSTIFNLSSNLNNNIQNSLQSYNGTFRSTVNVNLAAMMAMTNVLEEQTGHIVDLVSNVGATETDLLMQGIMKIMHVGLRAGFLKFSISGASEKRFYVSFMIPYRPTACEIKLVAVAAVDITYLVDATHASLFPDSSDARDANELYASDLSHNNANYTQWITELTTALNNSLDIVDAFIAADGGAQFA
jgi:hypothetical protein